MLAAAVLLSACISSQDAVNGAIRVVHAVPDAPRMNLLIDDELRVASLDFAGASAYIASPAGDYAVKIEEVLPGSGTNVAVFDESVDLDVNEEVTLVVVGNAAGHVEEVLQIETKTRGVPAGNARIQLVHAAVGGPPVDVYVTAPDAVIDANTPRFTSAALAYKEFTDPQRDIPSGSVKMVLTAPNDPSMVLFESGTVFLGLEATALVAIVPNTGPDAVTTPFSLVFATGSGSNAAIDKNSQSNLRLVNTSPDSYPLDVFFNDPSDDSTVTQRMNLQFLGIDGYFTLAPGSYDVKVQKTGDPATVPLEFPQAFVAGSEATLVFTNLIAQLERVTLPDNTRRVATEARLRLVHASPGAGTLDYYITDPGAALADETADFRNATLGANTGYISLAAGPQQVTFIVAGSKADTDIRATQLVTLENGGIYTMLLTDTLGGGLPAQVLSLDDPLQ